MHAVLLTCEETRATPHPARQIYTRPHTHMLPHLTGDIQLGLLAGSSSAGLASQSVDRDHLGQALHRQFPE